MKSYLIPSVGYQTDEFINSKVITNLRLQGKYPRPNCRECRGTGILGTDCATGMVIYCLCVKERARPEMIKTDTQQKGIRNWLKRLLKPGYSMFGSYLL